LSALVLYFRAPISRFRTFMFSLSFTYYLHYLVFIFLPAESPRFFMPGLRESLKGYWVSDWLQSAVENNAFPGGSFPSSHIAASVICFMVYPYLGKWRFPVFFLTLTMFAGTIYGRYHYFVDVAAGLGVGLCCYYLAPWLERKWPLILDEEGLARGRSRQALNRG
jgi:membrane-associated phospholipid phosphatase